MEEKLTKNRNHTVLMDKAAKFIVKLNIKWHKFKWYLKNRIFKCKKNLYLTLFHQNYYTISLKDGKMTIFIKGFWKLHEMALNWYYFPTLKIQEEKNQRKNNENAKKAITSTKMSEKVCVVIGKIIKNLNKKVNSPFYWSRKDLTLEAFFASNCF